MRKKERCEARKKVGIRVDELLYERFKEAVAVRTHKRHGMSDEFDRFMKKYIKSDNGRHDEVEGITSDECLDEDMKKNTTHFGDMKKNVSSHHEEAIDKETESGSNQRTIQVDVDGITIEIYNWFMEEYDCEVNLSDFVNVSVGELWKAKGFIVERVRTY